MLCPFGARRTQLERLAKLDTQPWPATAHPAGEQPERVEVTRATHGDWQHRRARHERHHRGARQRWAHLAVARSGALGEDEHDLAAAQVASSHAQRPHVRRVAAHRDRAVEPEVPADHRQLEELAFGHRVRTPARVSEHQRRVDLVDVVRYEHHGALGGHPRAVHDLHAREHAEDEACEQRGGHERPAREPPRRDARQPRVYRCAHAVDVRGASAAASLFASR